jgi:tetratricopeptide (TPR) repeat protein
MAMAQVKFDYDWDFPGAVEELRLAMDLNPGNVLARNMYGHYLVWLGRHDEALAQLRLARESDPFSMLTMRFMAQALFFAGRYDEALEQARSLMEFDDTEARAFYVAGRAYLQQGNYKEAIAALEQGGALLGGGPDSILAYAHAVAGNRAEAVRILNQLRELVQEEQLPYAFAGIYAGLGENDKALALLEDAYEKRSPFMIMLKVEPMFDSVRDDPRFQALLGRMNFPA